MPHIPIDPLREYTPKEIWKHGLILNTKGNKDYRYILRLIHGGKLKARVISTGSERMYFMVSGADLIAWKKSTVNIVTQPDIYVKKKREHNYYPQAPDGQS